MGLNLIKYFHRPGGDPDRRIDLILDGACDPTPTVMGFTVGGDNDTILRHDCVSPATALGTYREIAQGWGAEGFAEIVPINYWQWKLPPEPQPKPDWQRALDELALDVLVTNATRASAVVSALAATPAATEPLYLWFAGIERLEAAGDAAAALSLAGRARDEYAPLAAQFLVELEGFEVHLLGLGEIATGFVDVPEVAAATRYALLSVQLFF